MSCKGLKGKELADCLKSEPTYSNFAMANQARNRSERVDTKKPGTKRDSAQYKKGYKMGLKGLNPSAAKLKYEGESEFEKMGRWEGKNKTNK